MASLRGSSGAAGRPVRFHLTGFGKFNGVADNPSKRVVAAIAAANGVQTVQETRSAAGDVAVSCSPPAATPGPGVLAAGTRLVSATIFETSAQGAGCALEAVHASHDADDATSEAFIVYLHLGVSSRSEFSLELQGVNEASFRVPDERGEQPCEAEVVNTDDFGSARMTPLDVDALVAVLKKDGTPVAKSFTAGRFVCNWAYYKSLHLTAKQPKACSLFIHIPQFDIVPEATQVAWVATAMHAIAEQLRHSSDALHPSHAGHSAAAPLPNPAAPPAPPATTGVGGAGGAGAGAPPSRAPASAGAAIATPATAAGGVRDDFGTPRVMFHVTGFGKFPGVDSNPTEVLMKALGERMATQPSRTVCDPGPGSVASPVRAVLSSVNVLDVSVRGVRAKLPLIQAAAAAKHEQLMRAAQRQSPSSLPRVATVFLHFGVWDEGDQMQLESQAINEATFFVPDAAGLMLKNKPIDGALPYQSHLRTELELDSLVKKATAAGFKCTRSWDAGEYLCNYLYFHSLQYCKKAGFPATTLFVHVPSFAMMPQPTQVKFAEHIMGAIATQLSSTPVADPAKAMEAKMVELGMDLASARSALKATNYASIDAAVSWMFEHAHVAGAGPSTQRMKLVVVVNNTQSMGTGKIASQCCHAVLGVYKAASQHQLHEKATVAQWSAQGEPIVVVKGDITEVMAVVLSCEDAGLPCYVVRDAGRTQVEAGSVTAVAIGPAPEMTINRVTGSLKLL